MEEVLDYCKKCCREKFFPLCENCDEPMDICPKCLRVVNDYGCSICDYEYKIVYLNKVETFEGNSIPDDWDLEKIIDIALMSMDIAHILGRNQFGIIGLKYDLLTDLVYNYKKGKLKIYSCISVDGSSCVRVSWNGDIVLNYDVAIYDIGVPANPLYDSEKICLGYSPGKWEDKIRKLNTASETRYLTEHGLL